MLIHFLRHTIPTSDWDPDNGSCRVYKHLVDHRERWVPAAEDSPVVVHTCLPMSRCALRRDNDVEGAILSGVLHTVLSKAHHP